jgi:hypothetical protein
VTSHSFIKCTRGSNYVRCAVTVPSDSLRAEDLTKGTDDSPGQQNFTSQKKGCEDATLYASHTPHRDWTDVGRDRDRVTTIRMRSNVSSPPPQTASNFRSGIENNFVFFFSLHITLRYYDLGYT